MAQQRHRVWIARLVWTAVAFVGLLAVGGYAAKEWLLTPSVPSDVLQHSFTGATDPLASDVAREPHPLDQVLGMARVALARHREYHHDYTATLIQRVRLSGKLGDESRIELKLRYREPGTNPHVPTDSVGSTATTTDSVVSTATEGLHETIGLRDIDVYLRFLAPRSQAGRGVIWRQGFNKGMMIVHQSGMLNLMRIQLDPTSRLAMMGNRYPITDIGIERLLVKLIEKGEQDRLLGGCRVTTTEDFEFQGRACIRFEIEHPEASVTIDGHTTSFDYYRAIIDMDREHGIPIHYVSYLWPKTPGGEPLLDEEFIYEDLRLNAQLTDMDFDPDNKAYAFPSR